MRPLELLLIHVMVATQSKHPQGSVGNSLDGDARMTSWAQMDSTQTRFRRQWNWSILVEETVRAVPFSEKIWLLYILYLKVEPPLRL